MALAGSEVTATLSAPLSGVASSLAGAPAGEGATFAPGAVVAGRYRIARFVARGGMGEVYEAEDLVLRERLALKVIRPEIARDEDALRRFRREVQLARKVTHENVCRLFDVGFHTGGAFAAAPPPPGAAAVPFLTMEFLDGETLSERLSRRGPMTPAAALPLLTQMAAALAAAHRSGVIHHDFKSRNVVLVALPRKRQVRVVVTDFGLARGASEAAGACCGKAAGTLAYMAPEQLRGGPVGPAIDVYALGVVLFEMVTGTRPFPAESASAVRLLEDAPSPRDRVPDLDPAWEAAILRCLSREPRDRFPDAMDVVRALAGPKNAPARGRRPRAAALLSALALLSVLAVGGVQGRGDPARAAGIAAAPASRSRPTIAVLATEIQGVRASLPAGPEAARSYAEGLARLRLSDDHSARELLERAVAAEPSYPLAHLSLGEALSGLGHDARAQEEMKRAFDLSERLPRAERLLVEARYRESVRSFAQAAEIYGTLHEFFPDNLEFGLHLARAKLAGGHLEDVLSTVAALRQLPSPAGDDPRIDLVESYATLDLQRQLAVAGAAALKAQALKAHGLVAEARVSQATAWALLGDYRQAAAAALEARTLYAAAGLRRGEVQSLSTLGLVRGYSGDLRESRAHFEEALSIQQQAGNPGLSELHQLATLLLLQGDPAGARARLGEMTVRMREREPTPEGRLADVIDGWAALLTGDLSHAERALTQAMDSSRALNLPFFTGQCASLLGDAALSAGDLEGARQRYTEALSIFHEELLPIDHVYWQNARVALGSARLARVDLAEGRWAVAEELARRSLDQLARGHQLVDEAAAQLVLSRALLGQGRLAEAEAAAERAAALAERTQIVPDRIDARIVEARIRLAGGAAVDLHTARHGLRAALDEARQAGLRGEELEVRLALGEVERREGRRAAAKVDLAALAREARASGFLGVARQAAALARDHEPRKLAGSMP